ncbi:MAG: hypothetical protein IPJ49_22910 [Candidatus Obscuribacter sp.]|nr:hypothetical protein [Candidatus Obscuribacter sp.]
MAEIESFMGQGDPEWEREQEVKRVQLLRQAWLARNRQYNDLFGEPTWVSPKKLCST